MVSYPDLSTLSTNPTMGDLLALPNASNPFFWEWILGGIWAILVSTLFFTEKTRTGRGNILSSMAVSSFAIVTLSVVGSFVGFITLNLMVYIVVFNFIFIILWVWASSRSA